MAVLRETRQDCVLGPGCGDTFGGPGPWDIPRSPLGMAGTWRPWSAQLRTRDPGREECHTGESNGLMELQIDAIYHFPGICKPVAAWEDEIREKSNQIPSLSLLSVTREHNKCRNKQAGLPVPGHPPHWPQLSPQLSKVVAQRGSGACCCPAMVTTSGVSRKKCSPTYESHPMERPHTAT